MISLRRVGVAGLICLAVAACAPDADEVGQGADGSTPAVGDFVAPDAPVVLISVDTLRADRLPAYGYDAVETPAIDRLAGDSLLFESAWAHVPLTLPSHASLLTGLLPGTHGVRDNLGYELDPDATTLAEWLSAEGYRTGAAVAAYPMRAETGLDAGFDFFDDQLTVGADAGVGEIQRPGDEVLAALRGWLDDASSPLFGFFHIYEPHVPWRPPPEIEARYGATYDAEVVAADRVVGELLAELERRGLYDPALVILLSDHGEGLGDHGEEEHGILLNREVLRVPLLVKLPGSTGAGTRVADPVQLVDVFPTVASVLDRQPPAGLPGRSLLAVAAGWVPSRPIFGETWMPRLHFGWSELFSLVEYPWHYIHGPDPELYDLSSDPRELTDLAERSEHAARVAEMAEQVDELRVEAEVPADVDAATRRRLEALGYLSGGGVTDEGPLEDPKSQLPLLAELKEAAQLFHDGRHPEAVQRYRELLAGNPDVVVAWEYLGRAELALGRVDRAVEAFERLQELDHDHPDIDLRLAEIYARMDRLDDAVREAEAAARRHPAAAATILSQVATRRGDLAEAERQARIAVKADPELARAWMALAEALLQTRQRFDEALEAADRALEVAEVSPDPREPRGIRVLKGRILGSAGRLEQAAEAFEAEVEAFPDNLEGWSFLAAIRFARDGRDAGEELLDRMIDANPGPAAEAEAIRTLQQIGAEGAARERLRHALEKYPGDPRLRNLDP
ncbi:MAG: sulfatase-like hydrolase/transferase [Acidobacteriota bacterium]